MPIHYVIENAAQALTPDGKRTRHLRRDCKLLRQSHAANIRFDAVNTDALRLATVRCEHPPCWAAERRREGSPFGCVSCGKVEINQPRRDNEGRYRLCPDCFVQAAMPHTGLPATVVEERVFEPIVGRYEIARRPSKYRHHKGDECARCGLAPYDRARLHVHHIDGDRRNNDPSNLETLCDRCHQDAHAQSRNRPYAERNK